MSGSSLTRDASREGVRSPLCRWRTHVVAALVITATALVGLAHSPAQAQAANSRLDPTERSVVKLVNRYRARHGRARVHASRRLNRAADRHSRDMVSHGFFAHSSANGLAAVSRVRRASHAGSVGENLAFLGSGERNPASRVVRLWIASAGHRAVLLNPAFRRIGVGRRAGSVGGQSGSAYTADFASRR